MAKGSQWPQFSERVSLLYNSMQAILISLYVGLKTCLGLCQCKHIITETETYTETNTETD